MNIDRLFRVLAAAGLLLALALSATSTSYAQSVSNAENVADNGAPNSHSQTSDYRLGTGDKLRINVFGQTDINGDYLVDSAGFVQLPLIGAIKAAGRTVGELQRDVTTKLADGFFVNPSVSIEVENYRPFYIIGEVNKPGEYPYVNGMSILNAVALAGGYTFRADDTEVFIRRNGATKEVQFPADETTKIDPGDIVRVPERFF